MIPIKIRWSNGLINFNELADEMARVVAEGLGLPTAVLVEIMKRNTPVGKTGNLRASIGAVIGYVPAKHVGYGVVGPRRHAKGRPTRYAHLVEFGHVAVRPVKGQRRKKGNATDVTFVPAKSFVRSSVEQYAAACASDMAKGIGENLQTTVRAKMNGKRVKVGV